MADAKTPKVITALDTVAAELYKMAVPAQAVASWMLPIFIHVKPIIGEAPIPDRIDRLSRLVGVTLGVKAHSAKTKEARHGR